MAELGYSASITRVLTFAFLSKITRILKLRFEKASYSKTTELGIIMTPAFMVFIASLFIA
jgi:hypothetical protein